MNTGVLACFILGVLFCVLSIFFTLLKEKGAGLVSGFNAIPKEDQEKYDKKKISMDMRNSLLNWALVLLIGAHLGYFFNDKFIVAAIVIWLIMFFKDFNIDSEKAFEKYRKEM